jgi:DNA modification methylase/ParB-like chromosome segregation protein Spo0J
VGEGVAAVYLPVDALKPNPRNPRIHGAEVTKLARTILRTTWGAPVIAQASTLRIIGGHGRLEAAKLILAGVEVDGILRGGADHRFDRGAPGPALVPVRLVDVSDAEAEAMTLADNASALQGRDDASLAVEMATRSFERGAPLMVDMGYGADDLDRMVRAAGDAVLADAAGATGDVERHEIIGDAPQGEDPGAEEQQPDAPVFSKAGEVYELGPHMLICGDSRDAATWARIMGGAKASIVFTSPPYADRREYDAASGFTPISPDGYVAWWEPLQASVAANIAADGSFFVNIKASVAPDGLSTELYVLDLVIAHARRWGWSLATEFCWKRTGVPKSVTRRFKNQFEPVYQFTRGAWKMRPEAVMHPSDVVPVSGGAGSGNTDWSGRGESGLAQGVTASVFGDDRSREPGMAYPGNMLPTFNGTHESTGHTAAFPVGLPEFFIKAFSDAGDVIVDPFLGSGSTLIASAKTGRVCRGFEISPRYCDVIRRRWTKYARSANADPGAGALD